MTDFCLFIRGESLFKEDDAQNEQGFVGQYITGHLKS